MKAMLIEVNGKRVCLVSLDGEGHLHASLSWLREADIEGLHLSVVGAQGREPAIWPISPIQVGDDVRFRIVETDRADPPLKQSTMVSKTKKS
jgi:hypothetical protein